MIAGEREAASAAEAATLRPLLADHVAWTSSGSGAVAQVHLHPYTSTYTPPHHTKLRSGGRVTVGCHHRIRATAKHYVA